MVRNPLTHNQKIRPHLNQWEFPVCEDGGESRVFRSRASPSRSQLRTLPVEARESPFTTVFAGSQLNKIVPIYFSMSLIEIGHVGLSSFYLSCFQKKR